MNKTALVTFVNEQLATNPALTDAELLSLAQAVPPVVTDNFQVGSGVARGFFVFNGIWKTLRTIASDLTNPLSDLCDAVVITASDANSYFGIDPSKAAGVANLAGMQTLVDAGILTEQQRIDFLALSKSSTDEFAGVTLADIAEARITGTTAQTSVTYPANLNYLVRLPTQNIKVFITRTDTTYAQTIKIYKSEAPKDADKTLDASYIRDDNPIASVSLAAGQAGKAIEISKQTSVHLQLDGESDKSIPFDMTVEIV